jgi:hypothetical protein
MDRIDALAIAALARDYECRSHADACRAYASLDGESRDRLRVLARGPSVGLVHADACFRIGASHLGDGLPCQDYAVAEAAAVLPFAVVSDGCSSSGRTDVGSRLVALAAAVELRAAAEAVDRAAFIRAVAGRAMEAARVLGASLFDMDATLAAAQATPGGGAAALLFGDGVVAARFPDRLEVVETDWAGNMPGYPLYAADPERMSAFLAQSEAAAARDGRPPCSVRRWRLVGGAAEAVSEEGLSASEGLSGVAARWSETPDVVAVMSDGASQVSGADRFEVVSALTAVKSARTGAFVTRRVNRALAELARAGSLPVDDLSIAALAAPAGN